MSSAANPAFDDYQYQSLDHATQQIRLVTLLDPLENDDAIRLDISVFEISEAPPYTALSYVWGPPSSNDIYIANGRLEIRDNLFKFLTEFRKCSDKTPSDQYLWIDQLCIDQSNTDERNHQVQMMSDIYSKATSVVAWLGGGSEKACASPEWLAKRGCDKFENMYDAACAWKDVGEQAAIICKSSLRRIGGFIHLDMFAALDMYALNSCADPRDNIYGLLGLVRVDQRVTVDYEKSNDQLYLDLVLAMLQSQCLDESAEESPENGVEG
ncbi:hypothetical protein J4E90_008784 [Alternaria incomplexa]|uniref:uncharacterized protein n=1 Tax=Alternaria incomplexa TaxID=1187928 RepID=UPI0022209992|nr:uncharacterized protein J4E90_008784 [Alternaria incomplexa]KAI4908160.1 hypothetical protein J4E90_008784 [Alternaria incomplexa]